MSNAAAPGSVEWSASSEGTATWGDVSSAKYFQVQLYKDGNLVTPPDGSASTVSVYGTSYDFSSWVSAGSKYTFKVRSVKASNNAKSKWVSSSSWTPGSNTSDNNNTNTFPEGWQKAADGIRWWWQIQMVPTLHPSGRKQMEMVLFRCGRLHGYRMDQCWRRRLLPGS